MEDFRLISEPIRTGFRIEMWFIPGPISCDIRWLPSFASELPTRMIRGCEALPQSCPRIPEIPKHATHLHTLLFKCALFPFPCQAGDGKSA